MYKKLLVVVDDRVVTQSAIRQAIEIAHALGAHIHFFYFLPAQSAVGYASPPEGEQSSHDAQGSSTMHARNENIVADLISVATVPVLVCRDTGSSGGFGRRASVSIRARQRRLELMERRKKEKND